MVRSTAREIAVHLSYELSFAGEPVEEVLERRYGGSSRRAVLVSYRDALKRYRTMRRGGGASGN